MLNSRLLNTRLVREQDALLQFEAMAWMIRQYGAPARPPVPSPLHKAPTVENLVWGEADNRSVCDWAEDSLGTIKSVCQMDEWNITLVPTGDDVDMTKVCPTRTLTTADDATPYVVDVHGRPVLFYDPRDCVEPGYFTARAVLRLAELRATGFQSELGLSPLMARMVTLCAASYGRQGFALANLPEFVSAYLTADTDSRPVPHRIVMSTLCFSTCLALRVRRQSAEQIIATYGTRMPKAFRRKVQQACRQIDQHDQELKLLQLMAEPKPRRAASPALIRDRA